MKEAFQTVMDHIGAGETDEALELARESFPHLANRIIPLQGKYQKIYDRYSAGATESDKYHTQSTAVTYSLIELLSQSEEGSSGTYTSQSKVSRLISFKKEFLTSVISEFDRSKFVLFGTLAFVIIVGIVSAIFITNIMPTTWGKTVLGITLISFFTLVISSLGFLNSQIKQFQGTKSFLKFEEYSNPND